MKISLVTPSGKQGRGGNRSTADRWARILRSLGHRVDVSSEDDGARADMMIAIHAWRSAASIRAFAEAHPDRPLVVLLAGTDIYRFQKSHTEETRRSMALATRLVGLHDLVDQSIPRRFHDKLQVIYQSFPPLSTPRTPSPRWFEVCVVGNLRDEKDPLRAAYASRLAPADSRLRVVQLGRAGDDDWQRKIEGECKENSRLVWRGEVPCWAVRRQYARSHAMVVSSVMEGGANVVSEAIVCGLPVIASGIEGNVGLLGEDYEGYYPVGNETALARVLARAETDPMFLRRLAAQGRAKLAQFAPAREKSDWKKLLREMGV